MTKITPFIWFDDQAEEAANYYLTVFSDSKIIKTTRYAKSAEEISGRPAGSVMTVELELNGLTFTFLNGGKQPGFELNSAVSFAVECDNQDEIDAYWEKLSAVQEAEQCGWCKDKFGVTWQIVPNVLREMLSDSDKDKVERVTTCFMQMKKFDISELQKAYEG